MVTIVALELRRRPWRPDMGEREERVEVVALLLIFYRTRRGISPL